jgi:hypothetical protein
VSIKYKWKDNKQTVCPVLAEVSVLGSWQGTAVDQLVSTWFSFHDDIDTLGEQH